MTWIDWIIVIVPVAFVIFMGCYSNRYVRSVADFLTAGRVCGRYVIATAGTAGTLSIVLLTSYVEVHYKTGFALAFWQSLLLPLTILISLTGFCSYRYRETKVMSFGQFLEIRYNRSLRVFASALRSCSEVLANMITPAIAGRFFIYFLDLPHQFTLWGVTFQTFHVVMAACMLFAVSLIWMGGTLSLIITDSLQGMLFYPTLALIVGFILWKFSWSDDIIPVMMDRVKGESFLNPYDIENLRDFNLFMLGVSICTTFLHRASWIGGGYSAAAKSPHEQKMAGLLASWRNGLNLIFQILVAVVVIVLFNGNRFADEAKGIRDDISVKAASELIKDDTLRNEVISGVKAMPRHTHVIGVDRPLSQSDNLDTAYLDTVHNSILRGKDSRNAPMENSLFQQFRSLFYQTSMAISMRHLLPSGMLGVFCVLMILAMVSSDDSSLFSSAMTITQDVILPFRKTPLSPKQHIWLLRWVSLGVGCFFVLGSSCMAQLDYISMFYTIMTMIWLGGCGPVMIFGLYSRFGTAAGAFTSLLSGMTLSLSGIFIQRNWADVVYPFLSRMGWVNGAGRFLEALSRPFSPYVVWKMNPVKCPVNSYEIYAIIMLITLILYVVVSKFTCKEPFNMDRMLHRGIYNLDGENKTRERWSWRSIWRKFIGITPEYTKGDRGIAWAFFGYSFVYKFLLIFLAVVIWNRFSPWCAAWWGNYFLVTLLIIPGIVAAITSVWMTIGGIINMRQMFRDLKNRRINDLDNGMVSGHVSLADKREMEAAEAARKNAK